MIEILNDTEIRWNAWTPVSKAVGASEDKYLVCGIASTENRDQQGEVVLQKGIDFSPLMERGIINWNHRSGDHPAAIIGEPTAAYINEQGQFYLEAELYKGLEAAEAAWDLLNYYHGHPNTRRRLGWSIEGGGVRRGNLVTKTIVRHAALTHDPVNADSFASVVKSMTAGLDAVETELVKAMTTTSMAPLLLENLDSNGRANLVRHILLGESEHSDRIFAERNGVKVYKSGPISLYHQLCSVAKLSPADSRALVKELAAAGLVSQP